MTQHDTLLDGPAFGDWKVAIPLPRDEELSQANRDQLARMSPINVVRMFAGTEELFLGSLALSQSIFTSKDIDPKLRETLMLRISHLIDCAYEWRANVAFGRNVGLTDDQIVLLRNDGPVTGLDPASNLICRVTDEITLHHAVSDEALSQLIDLYGPRKASKYILTICWFNLLGSFLLSTRVPLETDPAILASRTSPFEP